MWGRTGAQHPFPPFAAKRGTIFYTDEASLRPKGKKGTSLFPFGRREKIHTTLYSKRNKAANQASEQATLPKVETPTRAMDA